MRRYPIISQSEWPTGYRVVLLPHEGAIDAVAEALADTGEFKPVVLRPEPTTVEGGGSIRRRNPGAYLLLSPAQADHWDAALDVCRGYPEATVAYLRCYSSPAATQARRTASIELLQTDALRGETVAFDVLVNGSYVGHWAETDDGAAASWTRGGEIVPTEICEGNRDRIVAAVRPLLPVLGHPAPRSRREHAEALPFEERELLVLGARQQAILRLRHGIGGGRRFTLEALGQKFALTKGRIRQIEKTGLLRIRRRQEDREKAGGGNDWTAGRSQA